MEQRIVYQREDGSFVITKNGHPYHVPNEGEYQEAWAEIASEISSGVLTVMPEPILEEVEEPTVAVKIQDIQAAYKAELNDLAISYMSAVILEDEKEQDAIKQEYVETLTKFAGEVAAVSEGE